MQGESSRTVAECVWPCVKGGLPRMGRPTVSSCSTVEAPMSFPNTQEVRTVGSCHCLLFLRSVQMSSEKVPGSLRRLQRHSHPSPLHALPTPHHALCSGDRPSQSPTQPPVPLVAEATPEVLLRWLYTPSFPCFPHSSLHPVSSLLFLFYWTLHLQLHPTTSDPAMHSAQFLSTL